MIRSLRLLIKVYPIIIPKMLIRLIENVNPIVKVIILIFSVNAGSMPILKALRKIFLKGPLASYYAEYLAEYASQNAPKRINTRNIQKFLCKSAISYPLFDAIVKGFIRQRSKKLQMQGGARTRTTAYMLVCEDARPKRQRSRWTLQSCYIFRNQVSYLCCTHPHLAGAEVFNILAHCLHHSLFNIQCSIFLSNML